jgi:hypothetical protein
MKTKHITLVIALGLTIVFVALLLTQYRVHVSPVITNNTSNRLPPTNAQHNVLTTTVIGGKTNTSSAENYSMKFIDPKTGQCAFVSLDRQTITLKGKNGNDIWTVNLASEASKRGIHAMGIELGAFDEQRPSLHVLAVNHSFELDLHTGEIIGIGAGRMAIP